MSRKKKSWYRIACVGDSNTYGFRIPNRLKNCYPSVLNRMLGYGYQVKNFGISGRTLMDTCDLPYRNEAIYKESIEFAPNCVIFMLGTNDAKKHNWTDPQLFMEAYDRFVKEYCALESVSRMIICSPVSTYENRTEVSSTDRAYEIQSQVVEQIAELIKGYSNPSVQFVDLHDATKNHPGWFNGDGIHLNEKGAKHVARILFSQFNQPD